MPPSLSSSVGAASDFELRPEGRAGRGIFGAARAHPFIVAVVTVLAVLAALIWSANRSATYEASAQVLVSPIPEFDRSLPQLPLLRASSDRTRVIQTAANLLDSPAAATLTAQRLGSGWTAARVQGAVDVLPEGESDVLSVTARASDAQLAARIANEFTRSALDARGEMLAPLIASYTAEIERQLRAQPDPSSPIALSLAEFLVSLQALGPGDSDPTLSLSRSAEPPSAPVGPSRVLLFSLSLIAGLAVGFAAALVAEMLAPARVADEAEATRATGLPVLARVPGLPLVERIRRSPRLRFRPSAAAALRTLQHQLAVDRHAPRRVLLVGSSPGDGATTCVGEFAMTVARAGHEVLAVDLDPHSPGLATRLGVSQPPTLSASLAAGTEWEASVTVPGVPGLSVLTIGAADSLGMPDEVAAELPAILEEALDRFDYVVVDGPPLAESAESLRVTRDVEAVVLVVRPGRTELSHMTTALRRLERAGRRPEGLLVVGGRARARRDASAAVGRPAEPAPAPGRLERRVEA